MSKLIPFASDFVPSCPKMLHIGTWYSTRIIAITFLLSSLSLGFSAKRQDYKENTRSNPLHSKSSNPANLLKSAVRSEICEGSSPPILPPSFILPSFYLWSRRAMMLLQILPDGSINGTLTFGPYGKRFHFPSLFFSISTNITVSLILSKSLIFSNAKALQHVACNNYSVLHAPA